MKTKLLKVITIVTQSILFIAIPFILFLLITSKHSLPGGYRSFVIMSGSMEPRLKVGSVIITKNKDAYPLMSVITFERGGGTITHRIVNFRTKNGLDYYQTRGDANDATDLQEVSSSNIIGEQIAALPLLGYLIIFMRSIPGFILFIIIPGSIFIFLELKSVKEEFENEILKKYQIGRG